MSTSRAPVIEGSPAQVSLRDTDWSSFDPWRIQAIRHRLVGHPLLQLDALVELGRRLEAKRCVRTHSNTATAGTPFNTAPKLHPNAQDAASTLKEIENANAWMSLLNVQTDPLYRGLVDEVLDSVRPHVARVDPGMCYRAGWIFVSSPNTVTPFHMDTEHGFLVQIQGRKKVYVWDHTDTEVASELARDRFFADHERDLLVWQDAFKQRAHVFDVQPGMGIYMPCTSPHMVENGDEPSITVSFTYYTDSTRRKAVLHHAHQRLRERGIKPGPVGTHPLTDTILHAGCHALMDTRQAMRRLAGKTVLSDRARYAYVKYT